MKTNEPAIDRSAKAAAPTMNYELNTAYLLPIPAEIGRDDIYLLHEDGDWITFWEGRLPYATHWCKRSPLPAVPKEPTQAEKDEAACKWFVITNQPPNNCWSANPYWHEVIYKTWFAALAYARKEQP